MILAAFAVEPLPPEQIGFAGSPDTGAMAGTAPLLDRLGNKLGLDALYRLEPRESHIPERASVRMPVAAGPCPLTAWVSGKPPRPIRLFEPPEPVDASGCCPTTRRFVSRGGGAYTG